MCTVAVVDTDSLSILVPRQAIQHKRDAALFDWICRGHGILAYAGSGQYSQELQHSPRIWDAFGAFRRSGQARLIPDSELERASERIKATTIHSNDTHILELALASDAQVLCSNDKGLKRDFSNTNVLPEIGQRPRAIYPVEGSNQDRRQFLQERECPNRSVS